MVKTVGRRLALLALLAIPLCANATICQLDDAIITGVLQWDDGSIFINVDKPTGCGCSQDFRVAFHKDDNQKFFVSAALTAAITGKKIFLRTDSVNGTCPIHGNTAKLLTLMIKS